MSALTRWRDRLRGRRAAFLLDQARQPYADPGPAGPQAYTAGNPRITLPVRQPPPARRG